MLQCNKFGSHLSDDEVVRSLNANDSLTVSVVDGLGFETATVNSLEQLCFNYAHEKVEQVFTEVIFKREVSRHACCSAVAKVCG